MTAQRRYTLVRWFLLIGVLLVAVKSAADLISHPAVVTTAGGAALVYLAVFALAILLYGGFALFRLRPATPNKQSSLSQSALWGLACGVVWVFEVLVANVIGPQLGPLNLFCYYGSTIIAYLLPGLAALLAARETRQISIGLDAGLLAGMVGALILFLAVAFPLVPLLSGTSQPVAQTLQEFQQSGLPDLQTFLIGDWLAAMVGHLWIGLITGFFLGLGGGALGKALTSQRDWSNAHAAGAGERHVAG